MKGKFFIEWPTVALFAGTYAAWAGTVFWMAELAPWLAVPALAAVIAFHSSLQHEAIHGHPTSLQGLNTAIAWPPLTLVIPYLRFRDTHLAHHHDETLTDPYDDPESHFMDPCDWRRLSRVQKAILNLHNTLAGRLLLGPFVGTLCFVCSDWKRCGVDRRIAWGWAWHVLAAAIVAATVLASSMPFWSYALAAYGALALLRIRTFLEHRAHDRARGRSVIIEDRGPLALLFLNNNLHAVHHAHPGVPWYRLPELYRQGRDRYLAMNDGYRLASYNDVFRTYLFRRKDPVEHPLRAARH